MQGRRAQLSGSGHASGSIANLCWHKVRCLQGGCRATKHVLLQVRWPQGHQTCAGTYKIQSHFFGGAKIRFWIPGQTPNDNQPSVLPSYRCSHWTSQLLHVNRPSQPGGPKWPADIYKWQACRGSNYGYHWEGGRRRQEGGIERKRESERRQ